MFLLRRVDFVSVRVIARNEWTRLRRRGSCAAEIIWAENLEHTSDWKCAHNFF